MKRTDRDFPSHWRSKEERQAFLDSYQRAHDDGIPDRDAEQRLYGLLFWGALLMIAFGVMLAVAFACTVQP